MINWQKKFECHIYHGKVLLSRSQLLIEACMIWYCSLSIFIQRFFMKTSSHIIWIYRFYQKDCSIKINLTCNRLIRLILQKAFLAIKILFLILFVFIIESIKGVHKYQLCNKLIGEILTLEPNDKRSHNCTHIVAWARL